MLMASRDRALAWTVLIAFEEDGLEELLNEAARRNMIDSHAWLLTDTPAEGIFTSVSNPALMRERMRGFRSFFISPQQLPGYQRAASVWQSMSPQNCTNPYVGEVPNHLFSRPPPEVFLYTYDATAAMVMALAATESVNESATHSDEDEANALLRAVRAVRLDGASGPVAFTSAVNGDRDVTDLQLGIFEWRGNSSVRRRTTRMPCAREYRPLRSCRFQGRRVRAVACASLPRTDVLTRRRLSSAP
jgi:hypothetical protein